MKFEDKLRIRYFEDEEFRQLADKIHGDRMLAGPACMQCMEIAYVRLADKESTKDKNEP